MFTATRRLSATDAVAVEIPALACSLGIAEVFFKFHSFLLEAAAFLAVWWVLGAALTLASRAIRGTERAA